MGRMKHPLRSWLDAENLSVKDFSQRGDFSYVTVYRLLKADGDFNTATIKAIAEATHGGVSYEALMQWHAKHSAPQDAAA